MTKREAMEVIGCSWSTLRRYVGKGYIRTSTRQNGHKNYWDEDVYAMVGKRIGAREHWVVSYARVNGRSKKADQKIEEQKRIIYQWCAKRGLTIDKSYEDRGPSTEYSPSKRPGLHELLQDIFHKRVDAVVVETRDRIARIGWEIFKELFKYHGVELIIINKVIGDPYYQSEQAEDLAKILDQAKIDRVGEIKEAVKGEINNKK
jgi:putative resolvase